MSRFASDLRQHGRWFAAGAMLAVVVPAGASAQADGQEPAAAGQGPGVVSTEVNVQRDRASLVLELSDGRVVTYALDDGDVYVDGTDVGDYSRGDALDRAWRSLLGDAMEADPAAVPPMLIGWQAPTGGEPLDRALESLFTGAAPVTTATLAPGLEQASVDSLDKLESRLRQMEEELEEARQRARAAREERSVGNVIAAPIRHIVDGLTGLIALLALWAVLVGIGFLAVFSGRRYLENVADTARVGALRAWLVGLAGSFLVVPVYILGMIALAISIVGIPLILVWAPLFPLALVLASAFGYMAVAHASGEAFAERRFEGMDWIRHGNSYYYVLTGLALLLGLFAIGQVIHLAGPWFDFIHGLIMFVAVLVTWIAFTIGFGAFLLSRGGTQRPGQSPLAPADDPLFEEETHV